jgi:small-conductance mechanosensitive channel
MPSWERLAVLGGVLLMTAIVAEIVDRRLARRELPAHARTRYTVLRRAAVAAIVFVGVLSALLVIPQVRAVAGGLLASSAILGLVIGFAARSTLANFVAGILIAIAQPVRLGDWVEVAGGSGVIEEIGLTYTFIRTRDDARLVIPNEKLASDTIRNATIISRRQLAEATVRVPLSADLEAVVGLLQARLVEVEVFVTALEDAATVTIRVEADDEAAAERLASDLRLRAHDLLRSAGILE